MIFYFELGYRYFHFVYFSRVLFCTGFLFMPFPYGQAPLGAYFSLFWLDCDYTDEVCYLLSLQLAFLGLPVFTGRAGLRRPAVLHGSGWTSSASAPSTPQPA